MASVTRSTGAHRKRLSLLFYRAVRDLKPVWMLEDMRTMETLYQEEEDAASRRIYSPSEALLYAIVHDHQAYARYLIGHYTEEALAKPGDYFCCCPASSSPHLAMAVRYDRRYILGLILQEARAATAGPAHPDARSCFHMEEDGRTALHVACELLRPEAALLLLGNGACPLARDREGNTPLDVLLEKLRDCAGAGDGRARRQCLDNLLMFTPQLQRFKMKADLHREPQRWLPVLGEETYRYLAGRSPAPLLLAAMRTVLQQLRPESFPDSLMQLPIPASLKPPGLSGSSSPGDGHREA